MKTNAHSFFKSILLTSFALITSLSYAAAAGKIAVKDGDNIAFLGDSITANGARKNGYVVLVMDALKKIPDEKGRAKMFGDPNYTRDIKNKLTSDGCHMNNLGNIMMAKGILKTFGMSDEKIAAAEKSWLQPSP